MFWVSYFAIAVIVFIVAFVLSKMYFISENDDIDLGEYILCGLIALACSVFWPFTAIFSILIILSNLIYNII